MVKMRRHKFYTHLGRGLKYGVRGGLFFGLIGVLVGCDAIYRLLDKEGAQEKVLIGEVIPFEKNPTVEEIQQLLKIYGYSVGRVDGVLGGRTRECLAQFQRDNGLPVSRFADDVTWAQLRQFKENGFIQNNTINVALLQQALIVWDLDPGPIDGKMGAKTLQAVKDFQQQQGLKVDGKVGYQTLRHLNAGLSEAFFVRLSSENEHIP